MKHRDREKGVCLLAYGLISVLVFVSGLTPLASGSVAQAVEPIKLGARVVINEVMVDPVSGNEWVELYNAGDETQTLEKWKLTATNVDGYAVGTTKAGLFGDIAPGSYRLFNSDGASRLKDDSPGSVRLFSSDRTIIDEVSYGKPVEGWSYGRVKDGGEDWMWMLPSAVSQSASNRCEVRSSSWCSTGLQEAINVADTGDELKISQNVTFEENIVVDKPLSLLGENKWNTVVKAVDALNGFEISADDVTVQGLKLVLAKENNQTARHLRVSNQKNIVLRDLVLYGPGKNSGYLGGDVVIPGVTGVELESVQDLLLERVVVEDYTNNGISVTAQYAPDSLISRDLIFRDLISRGNGSANDWAGLSFYTRGKADGPGSITGVVFEGKNTISSNPGGIFFSGDGGLISGVEGARVDVSSISFLDNSIAIVNSQRFDVFAVGSVFNGISGINSSSADRDLIEAQIIHNCIGSPYVLLGTCDENDSRYADDSLGSVEYASDSINPEISFEGEVVSEGVYRPGVKVLISEGELEVSLNGVVVDYDQVSGLQEEGSYTLIARDEFGNSSDPVSVIVRAEVMEEDDDPLGEEDDEGYLEEDPANDDEEDGYTEEESQNDGELVSEDDFSLTDDLIGEIYEDSPSSSLGGLVPIELSLVSSIPQVSTVTTFATRQGVSAPTREDFVSDSPLGGEDVKFEDVDSNEDQEDDSLVSEEPDQTDGLLATIREFFGGGFDKLWGWGITLIGIGVLGWWIRRPGF